MANKCGYQNCQREGDFLYCGHNYTYYCRDHWNLVHQAFAEKDGSTIIG